MQHLSEEFISEEQNGFRKGRSCTDAVFTLKLMIEKRRENNLETHLLFIDYEKAFDNLDREKLFQILESKNIPDKLLQAIVDIYSRNKIMIKLATYNSEQEYINKGVRQGCPLSPTLFNIYIDDIINSWSESNNSGLQITRNKKISTILFADDQLIISDSEDNLQISCYKLNNILKDYGLTISTEKSKVMAFQGKHPKRSKIVINNKIIEQVNTFNYLGNLVSYKNEKDIDSKISKFLRITGIINNIFKPNRTRRNTRLKLYSTLALPVLLYGSECWTIKAKDKSRLISAEMKFMRKTAGYIWSDFKRNEEILQELKMIPIMDKILDYKTNWINHVNRMSKSRFPKLLKNYTPGGRRDRGRPLKRLMEGF